jgi:hypothetical protein
LKHVMSDRPTIHQGQTDQHLRVTWLVVAAVAIGPLLGWPEPSK